MQKMGSFNWQFKHAQDQQENAELVDFIISHKDGEFFKSTLMPVIVKKNFNHFVQFAA